MANRIAFVLCCVVLVLATVAYGGVHYPVLALLYSLIAIGFILFAIDGAGDGFMGVRFDPLIIPLVGAAIYAFIQIIPFGKLPPVAGLSGFDRTISLDPFATWMTALYFTALTFFFIVLICSLDSAKRLRTLSILVTVFGFGFCFYAILQSVLSPQKIYGIYDVPFGSPFGSFVNRNNFAAYAEMTVALPLGLVFAGAVSKDKRLLYGTAIVLMGVALLLSGSRGGFVAFVAELIILVFLTRESTNKKGMFVRFGSVALLIFAIIAGSVFVGGDTSLTRFNETARSEDFTTDRSHIWTTTAKVIESNMPLGAGFGAFPVAYTRFDTLSGFARVEQAHNDYLQVVADAGIPGLLLGLLFLFFLFRYGRQTIKIENTFRRGLALGAFAGSVAVLVHSVFDFVLHVTAVSLLFLTLLAVLSASQLTYPDDVEDEHKRRRRKHRYSSDRSLNEEFGNEPGS